MKRTVLGCLTFFALVTVAVPGLQAQSSTDGGGEEALQAVRQYRETHEVEILQGFRELLSIPNVAFDTENIGRNAAWIRDALQQRGVEAELLTLADEAVPPIVYGQIMVPGAQRTLILYVHYDGQPALPPQWTHKPWEPVLYSASMEDGGQPIEWPEAGGEVDPEWRIYARSAGDDKAPIPAILAALDAMRQAGVQPTSNLKFFFEGEEEAGSPHLEEYLKKYSDKLEGDIWLFCDGPVHQSRTPQLVFGVRGIVQMELTVYGPTRYLHSGHYGNWAPNPAQMLAELLASMKDDEGNVIVEGYYDTVAPLSERERKELEQVPEVDAQLRRELGLARSENRNQPLMERLLLPSLNVRGMASASVGRQARNVIPTRAIASLDLRLVKGNDPQDMMDRVEAHIRRQGYHIVRETPDKATRLAHPRLVKVERGDGYPAARTRMDLPIALEIAAAARRASEDELIMVPSLGGSLPLYLFTDLLQAPLVITPIANHDDNQHAPDENLRLANLWYGIDLMGAVFTMP
ncbi:MAG TPA: M20/M25/M40 family metallo-hydrolase [Acidobacteriota bacterium]|nr:M20/M25/M40 family metallo-hydrolase [Acidobacteriota bacterium]